MLTAKCSYVFMFCWLTHSGRGSGTCQLSPSSLVFSAGVLSGFKLSSLAFPLKFPAGVQTLKVNTKGLVNMLKMTMCKKHFHLRYFLVGNDTGSYHTGHRAGHCRRLAQ